MSASEEEGDIGSGSGVCDLRSEDSGGDDEQIGKTLADAPTSESVFWF